MKKKLGIVLISLLLIISSLSGCSLTNAVDESRTVVEQYYEAFTGGDIEAVVALMHPSLVDNLGGHEQAIAFFSSIRAVHGEVESYDGNGFDTETGNEGSITTLEYNTIYENGDPTTDIFEIFGEDDVFYISSIDIPTAGTIETLTQEFIIAYKSYDADTVYDLLLPIVKADTETQGQIKSLFQTLSEYYGKCDELNIEETSANLYIPTDDGVFAVCAVLIYVDFEEVSEELVLYLAVQDGELGVIDFYFQDDQ